jgi:hypothetical protein
LFLKVFPVLRDVFRHYRDHLADVQSAEIVRIGGALCNLVYEYTLYGDGGLYYVVAYALSILGGEDWRRRLQGDNTELPLAFRTKHLNLDSDADVDEVLPIAVEQEAHEFEEEGESALDGQEEFVPSERDAALEGSITKRDHTRRLKKARKVLECVGEEQVFVSVCLPDFVCVHAAI